jgi:hypothetical protein
VAARPDGSSILRTVGSSVANSWFATTTSERVRAFISVDFPAFVYPAIATCGMPERSRLERLTSRVRARSFRSLRSLEMRRLMC